MGFQAIRLRRLRYPFATGLHRLNLRMTTFGERRRLSWLTYNPLQMRVYHQFASLDAPPFLGTLLALLPDATRIVDVGAGSGAFAAEARRQGLLVEGCERSLWGRLYARRQRVPCRSLDLRLDPPADFAHTFDVAWCVELAEHVPAIHADRLIGFLAALAPTIIFTAAPPGQGGTGHVNEQPPEYWIAQFARHGVAPSDTLTEGFRSELRRRNVPHDWLLNNLIVFQRRRTIGEEDRQQHQPSHG